MTFTAPLFLLAMLAGAIPVILHMINLQKAKEMPFSTLRFLQISVQKTRRRKRINDILLLILRTAILMLLAVGLAGPALTSLGSLWGSGSSTAVAIVLDNSASMGIIDHGKLRFKTALNAAGQILEEVADGDPVALFLTGGAPFAEQGKLARTHEAIRQKLNQWLDAPPERCGVTYERADLAAKVREAQDLLNRSKVPNKQIYVISDLQALSWETESKNDTTAKDKSPPEIPVIFIDCNVEPKPNVSVTSLELDAPLPVVGVRVKATVELFNASAVEQQRHLELYVNDEKIASSPVLKITAGERLKHDFQFAFQEGGSQSGEVRLVGKDGSSMDDRRFFAMEIDQGIPVAIVKPRTHEIPYLEDTFYMEQALAPARSGGWALQTTMLTADQLANEPLSNYKVVYLVNLPAPESDTADQLDMYVKNGGNLVWICGDNVDVEAYNTMNHHEDLLPAPLLEIRTPDLAQRDSWNIAFLDKNHPALSHLVEPASLYQKVLVYQYVQLDTSGDEKPWIMAKLDNGEALLVERHIENGTVTMLGTSAHVGWTNLPLRQIFLPLMARLTFTLAGAVQAERSLLAGAPLVVQFGNRIRPGIVQIRPPGPDQEVLRLSPKKRGDLPPKDFRYADTHRIGVYRVSFPESATPVELAFSVNFDSSEAETAKIDRQELVKRFGQHTTLFADNPEDLSNLFKTLREGKSLWGIFLSIVLIALVFETLLSNRMTPGQEEEKKQQIMPGMRRLARKGHAAT